ncbi:hypothetical protein EDB19DRAFT_1681502, partial [Suillus lakei]
MEADVHSPPTGGARPLRPHSSARAFLARLSSHLHHSRPDNAEANDLPQPSRLSMFHPRELLARLSPLVHRSRPENDEANEGSSTPSRLDPHVLLTRLSTLWSRPQARLDADKQIGPHPTTPLGSRPDALISRLPSLFRSQPRANEEMELSECSRRPHVVEVATMRDREVLFVAPQQQPDRPHHQSASIVTPGARPVHPRPIQLLGHLGLFLCCVCNHQHADDNAQST